MVEQDIIKESEVRIPRLDGRFVPATLREVGHPLKRVCILVHGIFVTRSENGRFDRFAESLANHGISNIRIDLSGHGTSEISSLESTVASMTDDIAYTYQYLRHLDVQFIDIVASSFAGALLSLLCGNKQGPNFSKVIFLNPVLDFNNVFIEAEMPEMADMFSAENISSAFQTGSFFPVPHFQMSRGFLIELMNIDVPKAYNKFVTPHLVLHGTADELVSYEHTRRIVSSNRWATWKYVKGAKHAFNTEQTEAEAYKAALDWLLV